MGKRRNNPKRQSKRRKEKKAKSKEGASRVIGSKGLAVGFADAVVSCSRVAQEDCSNSSTAKLVDKQILSIEVGELRRTKDYDAEVVKSSKTTNDSDSGNEGGDLLGLGC